MKRCELHADYVAGYIAPHQIGDFSKSIEHHGTPTERANAISEGFSAFKEKGLRFNDAVDAGVDYVKTL